MLEVGFEPTSTNTTRLKRVPLDQLGHSSFYLPLLESSAFNLARIPMPGFEPGSAG